MLNSQSERCGTPECKIKLKPNLSVFIGASLLLLSQCNLEKFCWGRSWWRRQKTPPGQVCRCPQGSRCSHFFLHSIWTTTTKSYKLKDLLLLIFLYIHVNSIFKNENINVVCSFAEIMRVISCINIKKFSALVQIFSHDSDFDIIKCNVIFSHGL